MQMDFLFWIKFVSVPVVFIIFTALWHIQKQLTSIRVEMARDYVSHRELREFEERLIKHLDTIERKIEMYLNKCAPAPQGD